MGHDVFISYSSRDRKAAEELCRALEAGKVRVWMAPRDLAPSSTWATAIPSAIEASRVVILAFSKHCDDSVWVAREIEHAVSCKRKIMAVRLVDAEPSAGLKFYLNTLHWLDAFPGALTQHLPHITRQTQQLLDIKPAAKAVAKPAAPPKAPAPVAAAAPAPLWRRREAKAAAVVAVALLLAAWSGTHWLAPAATPDVEAGKKTSSAAVVAGDCSSTYQEALAEPSMKDFELPGNDDISGEYTVIDIATLKVRDKTVKLSGVGQGDASGVENLRLWLEMAGPTIVCRPADERRCRYVCESETHQDLSRQILSSSWATPSLTSASSQN